MTERVVQTSIGAQPPVQLGLVELAKSKKGTALASTYAAIVPLILADKLPAIPGAIILACVSTIYMASQAVVDVVKERNRGIAREVITTTTD